MAVHFFWQLGAPHKKSNVRETRAQQVTFTPWHLFWEPNPYQRIDALILVLCNTTHALFQELCFTLSGKWSATILEKPWASAHLLYRSKGPVTILVSTYTKSSCQEDKICVALLDLYNVGWTELCKMVILSFAMV